MPTMTYFGKAHGLQMFVRLSYRGDRFYGVSPQREGPSVQQAVFTRLCRVGLSEAPYAVNFAARTDRDVQAIVNWLSFRLRLRGPERAARSEAIVAALEKANGDDGIFDLRAQPVKQRLMARNCVVGKHYRYVLPGTPCAADITAPDAELKTLQQAAAALSGQVHVARLAHPGAVRALNSACRGPILVTVQRADAAHFAVDVFAAGFMRRQVRYIVGALKAVQRGAWSSDDVAHLAKGLAGPARKGFDGPAEAAGLTLMSLLPTPKAAELLHTTLGDVSRAAFAPWLEMLRLSARGAP